MQANLQGSNLYFSFLKSYDYVKIANENNVIFGVICGVRYGTDFIVTGEYVRLTFHSDSEVQRKGFNVSFTVVPKPGE